LSDSIHMRNTLKNVLPGDSADLQALTRRELLSVLLPSLTLTAAWPAPEGVARARGRTALQGRLSMRVPWALGSVDPHRLDDGTAAIFGDALFDTLYAQTIDAVAPSLAEAEPTFEMGQVLVKIREGIRSASGKAMDARDVVFSIERARKYGARGWFGDLSTAKIQKGNSVAFVAKDSSAIAKVQRALSSPLAAIVPRDFDPEKPDGTGPFWMRRRGDGWVLARNRFAARGPAYLDEVILAESADLAASLRNFEAGRDDVGFLGMGLHEPRPDATAFDCGLVAYPILRIGKEVGLWDAPGTAQRLCDGLPHSRISYLGIGAPWPQTDVLRKEDGWGGPSTSLLVREDVPWLVELARAVAAILTKPGHEVAVKPISDSESVRMRGTRAFGLMIDLVRPCVISPHTDSKLGLYAALVTADDPAACVAMIQRAPHFAQDGAARTLTRTMNLGVLGEIRFQGGRANTLTLKTSPRGGPDFSSATQAKR
jgi:peptide/nickel transport system substrate-binding protein